MPKEKESFSIFASRIEAQYPGVFRNAGSQIKCIACNSSVNGQRLSLIKQHLLTSKHVAAQEKLNNSNEDLTGNGDSEAEPVGKQLCNMFLKANIPLYKIGHPAVKEFFEKNLSSAESIPCESTMRRKFVPQLYKEKLKEIRAKAEGKYIWASIDETTDEEQRRVANFVFGILDEENPMERGKAYLLNMATVDAVNAETMAQFFNDSVAFLWPNGICYSKILLIVTDAAPYMCAAVKSLKILYPKMLHITCFSHGLHRLAEFVRSKFVAVNDLIASCKAVFVKAPSRKAAFREMAPNVTMPPSPCITRWTSWLKAAIYYCENFEAVSNVINTFNDDDAEAICKAKELFGSAEIKTDLAFIKNNFSAIISATVKFEGQGLELSDSISTMERIRKSFKGTSLKIYGQKLESILSRNKGYSSLCEVFEAIYNGKVPKDDYVKKLSPEELILFKYCPVSSADVERFFSSYSATLTENRRSFSFENLKQHMIVKCNQQTYN